MTQDDDTGYFVIEEDVEEAKDPSVWFFVFCVVGPIVVIALFLVGAAIW